MIKKNWIVKKMKMYNQMGKSGTPKIILHYGKTHPQAMSFISKRDQKGSHYLMKKRGLI